MCDTLYKNKQTIQLKKKKKDMDMRRTVGGPLLLVGIR